MAGLLAGIRRINRIGDVPIAEPFAGGAGASLSLLYLEETPRIYINDADPAIHDFWWSVTHRPRPFLERLSSTRVNIAEWRRQRSAYKSRRPISRLRRGFSAFFLNRTNRSGIIVNGGPIGGVKQNGPWKIDARFNKVELRRRCEKILEYSKRMSVSGEDGIEFIKRHPSHSVFFFIDPPYFNKGRMLYLNALERSYHIALAAQLNTMSNRPWVLTYDDCPEIRGMYKPWANIRSFKLDYAASSRRRGREILITPRWMALPERQSSAALTW